MTTREMATEYRLSQWAQAMQERVSEGTSIKDFCQNRGISKTTYFYWQRKLREAAAARMIMETGKTPQGIVPSG